MIRLFIFVLALLCHAPSVMADTGLLLEHEPGFLLAAPTNVSTDLKLQADFGYVDSADFSNGLGSVSVARGSLAADYAIFRLSYEVSHFNWESEAKVARTFGLRRPAAPWDNLHDIALQARLLNNKLFDNWRYWINGEVNSSFEETIPGATSVGFDGGMAYDFWDGWMLGVTARTLAVSALSRDLFGEVEFGLALAVSQKSLRKGLQSLGLFEESKPGSEKIGLNFAFSRSEKTYRLAADNPVYGDGYLGMVRSKVGAYVDYLPRDDLILSIGPEYHYRRQYKLYNSAGSYKSSHELGNSLGGYARIHWRF